MLLGNILLTFFPNLIFEFITLIFVHFLDLLNYITMRRYFDDSLVATVLVLKLLCKFSYETVSKAFADVTSSLIVKHL